MLTYKVLSKLLIPFFIMLLFSGYYYNCDGDNYSLKKYEKAYEYIINDKIYIQNCFRDYFEDSIKNLCVSQEIIKYNYGPFKDDIILYYQDIYDIDSDSARSLFQKVENSNSEVKIKFDNHFDKTPCDLIIFFSRIKENQFRAIVEIFCEECKSYSSYHSIPMPKFIFYYFIFEDENIVKVFKEIGYR